MFIRGVYSTAWNNVSLFMLVYQCFINREGSGPYNKFTRAIFFIYVPIPSQYRKRHVYVNLAFISVFKAHTHKLHIIRHFTDIEFAVLQFTAFLLFNGFKFSKHRQKYLQYNGQWCND